MLLMGLLYPDTKQAITSPLTSKTFIDKHNFRAEPAYAGHSETGSSNMICMHGDYASMDLPGHPALALGTSVTV
jgi:hypothetical protein